jgi:hypothetical protein
MSVWQVFSRSFCFPSGPFLPQVKHTFLCESDSQKLEFLKRAFPDAGHIFTDMVDVSKGRAKDFLLDGQWQTVPEARTLVMGPGMMMFIF